ncbi:hypothetical protein STSU_031935 [Streptomyces tsukubensis NRRL18488]|uniref:Uncharacterized protein n=1 Tax=Streptomyces tsukubensis (strain DSM 42081 / NBRC 108919 / NRRL 18488 / 9993) TaxID=1114943 RepID=A0A7G3UKY7_STRT9|nr:hypothetical protein STSU_031935 [Streptomyces tsukubensis NRRL18488]
MTLPDGTVFPVPAGVLSGGGTGGNGGTGGRGGDGSYKTGQGGGVVRAQNGNPGGRGFYGGDGSQGLVVIAW